eukprot:Gb_05864 [translate_table: standard]
MPLLPINSGRRSPVATLLTLVAVQHSMAWHVDPPWPCYISVTPGLDLTHRAQFHRADAITRHRGGRSRPPTPRVYLPSPERSTPLPTRPSHRPSLSTLTTEDTNRERRE